MNRVITIDRQYGSAGRAIGRLLGERLGISCYDSNLLDTIADKTGLDQRFLRENGEYSVSASWVLSMLAGRDYSGHTLQDEVWNVQRETILELARKESCVIVGRCADYILKDRADLLRIFIHADEALRLKRVEEEYGEIRPGEDGIRKLRQMDKRRKAYCHLYTEVAWGEARFYDLCLDSGTFGVEGCVDLIIQSYQVL